jgi:hypothetical protein
MISQRVKDDANVEPHGKYLIGKVGKRYRVYADGSYYSQTSGGVMQRGKVFNGVDGKAVSFASQERAEAWIDKGRPLIDQKCNDLFDQNGREII